MWTDGLTPEEIKAEERRRYVLEPHGALVIGRLNRLIAAGYKPVYSTDLDWIDLEHPAAPHVSVWPDGQVVDRRPSRDTPDSERIIIAADDEPTFARLIARTPAPSWWERVKRTTLLDAWWLVVVWTIPVAYLVGAGWIGGVVQRWFHHEPAF